MTFTLAVLLAVAAGVVPVPTAAPAEKPSSANSVSVPPPSATSPAAKPARGAVRTKLAVMEIKAVQGVSAGTVEILGNVIAADMARQGFDVIARSDIQAMLGFQKERQLLGCTDDAGCIAEIGGSLGVDFVVTGQIGQIGSQFNISLLAVETRKARVASRLSSFCDANEDALVKAARAAVGTLAAAIRGGAPPAPVAEPVPLTRSRTTAWLAWGASAALLAGGATVGIIAKGKYDDLEAQRDAPDYREIYEAEKDDIRALNLTADALYVGGAVMAGLGAWIWFRVEDPPVTLAPVLNAEGAGLRVAGRF